MARFVLFVVVMVMCLPAPMLTATTQDWTAIIKPAYKQVMRLVALIEGEEDPTVCTVVVLNEDQGVGLTAAHCVRKPQAKSLSLTANGRHAELLKVNDLLDLALIKTNLRGEQQITLAEETPPPGTPIAIVGYAKADPDVAFQFGHVSQTKNSVTRLAWLNADVIGGDSGGAAIDAQGRLVAVQSQLYSWYSSGLGISVPVEAIREFAQAFLPKPKP